jgi:hypothetical protein
VLRPLETSPMPTHAALIAINSDNSWRDATASLPVRYAYVATNSTQPVAFASLQQTTYPERILRIATRPSSLQAMPDGVVVEVHLTRDLASGETIYLSLAQAGATGYFPPQPIADREQ